MRTVRHSEIRVTDAQGVTHVGQGASVGEAVGDLESRWRLTPAGQAYLARRAEGRLRGLEDLLGELEARVRGLEATVAGQGEDVADLAIEVARLLAALYGQRPAPDGGRP